MKRNRIKGKSGKSSKKLVTVVMAAMIVSTVMTAFIPGAAAGNVTAFNITPDQEIAGTISSYIMTLNTTGFSLLNVTIPAGFGAQEPRQDQGGAQIAKIDFWNSSIGWLANVTITANSTQPSNKVDIEAFVNTTIGVIGPIKKLGVPANYTLGNTTTINYSSPPWVSINATLALPTVTKNGSLNISFNIFPLIIKKPNNVSINFGQFVKNPEIPGDYVFTAKADGEPTGVSKTVHIRAPAPVPALTPIGLLALVGILSIVLAFATSGRKAQK